MAIALMPKRLSRSWKYRLRLLIVHPEDLPRIKPVGTWHSNCLLVRGPTLRFVVPIFKPVEHVHQSDHIVSLE